MLVNIINDIVNRDASFYVSPEAEINHAQSWLNMVNKMGEVSNGKINMLGALFEGTGPSLPLILMTGNGETLAPPNSDAFLEFILNHQRRKIDDTMIYEMREQGFIKEGVSDDQLKFLFDVNSIAPGFPYNRLPKLFLVIVKSLLLLPFTAPSELDENTARVIPLADVDPLHPFIDVRIETIFRFVINEESLSR